MRLSALLPLISPLTLALISTISYAELVVLPIQSGNFPDSSSVSVFVDAGLLGDDEVTSSISGELTIDLLPTAINPTSVQIVDFQATVDDEIDFAVGGRFLLPSVTVSADAGALQFAVEEPGPPGDIAFGEFSQTENLVRLSGVVNASIDPEPIDLGEEDPVNIDFENVMIQTDRDKIVLSSMLELDQEIPFDVGLFDLTIEIQIDGSIESTAQVPPADYTLVLSNTGNTPTAFSSATWLRGGVAETGSLPVSRDSIAFQNSTTGIATVDLESRQSQFEAVDIAGRVQLTNGQLDIDGLVRVSPQAVLILDANAQLTAQSMVVEADSAVTLSTAQTIEVVGDVRFESNTEIRINDLPTESGEFILLAANDLDLDFENTTAFVGESLLASDAATHLFQDQFVNVDTSDNTIRLINTQALPGDANGDGKVEFADFLQLSAFFGQPGSWPQGDFDHNGLVEFTDFLVLSRNFGVNSGTEALATVPEPRLLSPWGVVLIVMLSRRRSWAY